MKTIQQGRPRSSYFWIVQPPDIKVNTGEEISCVNPTTKEETKAICTDKFTQPWHQVPDSFCLLNYGWNTAEIKEKMEEKYPELKNETVVRFILMKEKK